MIFWQRAHRAHDGARQLADRHYNRQKVGTKQFVPPGRCLVLYHESAAGKAFWVTSYPFAEYVRHAWAGALVCSAFRNESTHKASALILEACLATLAEWPWPEQGMISFIDMKHVKPTFCRGKPTYDYTYRKAGFQEVGKTKGGLLAFQLTFQSLLNVWTAYESAGLA